MARHKYKFSDKKHSVGGVISSVMALCSILILIRAIVISFQARGEGGIAVGNYSLLALTVAVFGTVIGLLSFRETERYYTFSFSGSLVNGIMSIFLIMMIFAGL